MKQRVFAGSRRLGVRSEMTPACIVQTGSTLSNAPVSTSRLAISSSITAIPAPARAMCRIIDMLLARTALLAGTCTCSPVAAEPPAPVVARVQQVQARPGGKLVGVRGHSMSGNVDW